MHHCTTRSAITAALCLWGRCPDVSMSVSEPARARLSVSPEVAAQASNMIDEYRPPSELWEQPPAFEVVEEVMGPWELQCTIAGMDRMWVELDESGSCSCSSRVGKGRKWSAELQRGGSWRVRFVLLDKLSRQLRWEGIVRRDDVRGLVISGTVRGPPKRGASAIEVANGVVIGEFAGYPA
jgi:hypothetical protein